MTHCVLVGYLIVSGFCDHATVLPFVELIDKRNGLTVIALIGSEVHSVLEFLEEFCDVIEGNYNGANLSGVVHELSVAAFEVDFSFYVTDSEATDKDGYKETNYTIDNGNVVMVTYQKGTEKVNFILNYNSYAVRVTYENPLVEGDEPTLYTIPSGGYIVIDYN